MLNHPFNEEGTKRRLLWEYRKYDNFIIGLDFDNTLRDTINGEELTEVIELLQICSLLPKMKICLWSIIWDNNGRGLDLEEKLKFCKDYNIRIDYVNESPRTYGENRKAYFNILLDDRAGLESAYNCLKYVVEHAVS